MHHGLFRFLVRRVAFAVGLVFVVSSAALLLAAAAPDDMAFRGDPTAIAAERHRLGLDRPLLEQYGAWIGRAVRMDFGESLRFQRPVSTLLREGAINTALLGACALLVATILGIPIGVFTGSRGSGALARAAKGTSMLLLSIPPLILSLVLLLIAARTGWLPAGGIGGGGTATLLHLVLPSLALALPIAASLERLQSRAMHDALADPSILAALARGVPRRRVIWRHGLRLSLKPVVAIYGIVIGTVLSGSFAVEIVMAWPGLGRLTYEALRARDLYLVAGCAAAGSVFLAGGILMSDLALAAIDPRVEDPA